MGKSNKLDGNTGSKQWKRERERERERERGNATSVKMPEQNGLLNQSKFKEKKTLKED